MREKLAKWLALATGVLVLVMAIVFAVLQNFVREMPPEKPGETTASLPWQDAQMLAKGRAVLEEQYCLACHSIAGEGNTRLPLDGIGARLPPEEMRLWIAPPPSMREKLPPRAYEAKQQFRELPKEEMDALVGYLGSLR